MQRSVVVRRVVILILLMLFSFQSLKAIKTNSATFDEVQNFALGKYLLENGRWDVMGAIAHPPLGYYLTSLPLLSWNEDKQYWNYGDADRTDIVFLGAVDVYRGQGFLAGNDNKGDRLLILSRLPVLFLTLLLGVYVCKLGREMYGAAGGEAALLIFAFCPNMLAFSGIGTQDMPLAAFWFIASYYLWRYLKTDATKNALLTGIFIGLAIAVKFTALLLLPISLLLYGIARFKSRQRPELNILLVLIVPVIILAASYGFKLLPLQQGIELLQLEMKAGQSAFLMGQVSSQSWWYFYPVAFLLKTPLPVLILFCTSVVYQCRYMKSNTGNLSFLLLPILVLFITCSSSNFAVGTRYLLPVYPYMFVAIGALAEAGNRLKIFTVLFMVWLVLSTIHTAPHYLAYFNELAGGPDNGYKYLADSNLDWGQSLKELKKYLDLHGIKRVSLSYFGADSPARYGIEYDWLPSHHLYNPAPDKPVQMLGNRYLAISVTNLHGVYLQNRDEFRWLKDYTPVAKIGYSIFVYDLATKRTESQ